MCQGSLEWTGTGAQMLPDCWQAERILSPQGSVAITANTFIEADEPTEFTKI